MFYEYIMRGIIVLCFILATTSAATQRIVGGSEADISQYPSMANLLHSFEGTFFIPACAGAIINTRRILTAASCLPLSPSNVRARVGSSFATSGGTILVINSMIYLASYNPLTLENDIGIINTVNNDIIFVANAVQPANFAGENYIVPDGSIVNIAGWGRTATGHFAEQLRHAQVRALSRFECRSRLGGHVTISNSVMCTSGDGGFRPDVCQGDNGSPVFHNNVVVGIVSRPGCSHYWQPSVHTLISAHIDFIRAYA